MVCLEHAGACAGRHRRAGVTPLVGSAYGQPEVYASVPDESSNEPYAAVL
jgi:hypothetical protein